MAGRKGLPRDATSVRLTPEARQLWAMMAAQGGMTQAGWLEMMIRRAAKRRKVSLSAEKLEPNGTRRLTGTPAVRVEPTGSDPWAAAAVAAKEYYETDPEAVEWAMLAGDTLDDAG